MADIKLFRLLGDSVCELKAEAISLEKSLQLLLEKHLESFLGVRLIASEYDTGKKHGGRIDTLGIDENASPVIIEYKRSLNENVINQGLFYLDWLMDHRDAFKLRAMERLGSAFNGNIDWSGPRLLCIAGDFTRYDEYAVMQIPRNIELLRYRHYGHDLLMLELVKAGTAERAGAIQKGKHKDNLGLAPESALQDVFESLSECLLALGSDVTVKELENYHAFRRLKNFACVKLRHNELQIWVRLDPSSIELEKGFTRDVTGLGHHGTGDLEIRVQNKSDLDRAKPLLLRSYKEN